jgi:hypothetical protein
MVRDCAESRQFRIVLADLDATNHTNIQGLVSESLFNPKSASSFLCERGIYATADPCVDDAILVNVADHLALEDVRFALICCIAAMSYELEASVWCTKARMHKRA